MRAGLAGAACLLLLCILGQGIAGDPEAKDPHLLIRLPGNERPEGFVVILSPLDGQTLTPPPETVRLLLTPTGFDRRLVVTSLPSMLVICNETDILHNIYSKSPTLPFDMGLMERDTVGKSVPLTQPGRVDLHCSIRDIPTTTVLAVSSSVPLIADPEGRVNVDALPPGKWLLRTWQQHPRRPDLDTTITLPLTQPLILEMSE